MMSNEKVIYELHFEFKDGRPGHRSGNYTDKRVAENAARQKKEWYGYKSVKVVEARYTPSGSSANACMLTIAR